MSPRPSKKVKAKEQLPPENVVSDDYESFLGSESGEMSSKTCGVRVWSNEDEINLLRAMNDYKNKKGLDPNSKSAATNFKGKFQYDFSLIQIKAKMNGLRRKYLNAKKRCEDGADPVYYKPHDCLVLELSKTIWADYVPKASAKVNADEDETDLLLDDNILSRIFRSDYTYLNVSVDDLAKNYPSLGLSSALIASLTMIGPRGEMREWDNEWKKLLIKEKELKDEMKAMVRNRKRSSKVISTNGEI